MQKNIKTTYPFLVTGVESIIKESEADLDEKVSEEKSYFHEFKRALTAFDNDIINTILLNVTLEELMKTHPLIFGMLGERSLSKYQAEWKLVIAAIENMNTEDLMSKQYCLYQWRDLAMNFEREVFLNNMKLIFPNDGYEKHVKLYNVLNSSVGSDEMIRQLTELDLTPGSEHFPDAYALAMTFKNDKWNMSRRKNMIVYRYANYVGVDLQTKWGGELYQKFKDAIAQNGIYYAFFSPDMYKEFRVEELCWIRNYYILSEKINVNQILDFLCDDSVGEDKKSTVLNFLASRGVCDLLKSEFKCYKGQRTDIPEISFPEDQTVSYTNRSLKLLQGWNKDSLRALYNLLKNPSSIHDISEKQPFLSAATTEEDFLYTFGIEEEPENYTGIDWIGVYKNKPGISQVIDLLCLMGYSKSDLKKGEELKSLNACFRFNQNIAVFKSSSFNNSNSDKHDVLQAIVNEAIKVNEGMVGSTK